ncbi:MAG TPA: hypothetical protein VFC63_07505 [Blastocatellia bacterium]|nr:hypothetical protein [Blastocatellia bacterium]
MLPAKTVDDTSLTDDGQTAARLRLQALREDVQKGIQQAKNRELIPGEDVLTG